jgi:hypothetical protein
VTLAIDKIATKLIETKLLIIQITYNTKEDKKLKTKSHMLFENKRVMKFFSSEHF